MNWKEYSRLRSIARKRIERAAAAGKTEYVFIPTVKQAKASGNPEQYMNAVKAYLNDVPSLREAKDAVSIPSFNVPGDKAPKKPRKPLTEAQRARRRESNRRSKAKRAIEKTAENEQIARKQVGYLRALETVASKWREAGLDVGNWLGVLSPKKAKQFVNYMEYRFSQGDYKNRYTIDTFIRDFGELVQRGYDFDDIQSDFGAFLDKQKELGKNKRRTNKYGITQDEIDSAWRKFVKGDL